MEQRMHGLVRPSSIRSSGTSYVGTPRLQLHRLAAARLCAPNGCLSYAFTPTDGVVVCGAHVGRSMHTRLAEVVPCCRDTQDVWEISRAWWVRFEG